MDAQPSYRQASRQASESLGSQSPRSHSYSSKERSSTKKKKTLRMRKRVFFFVSLPECLSQFGRQQEESAPSAFPQQLPILIIADQQNRSIDRISCSFLLPIFKYKLFTSLLFVYLRSGDDGVSTLLLEQTVVGVHFRTRPLQNTKRLKTKIISKT